MDTAALSQAAAALASKGLQQATLLCERGAAAFRKLPQEQQLAVGVAAGVVGLGALWGLKRLVAPGGGAGGPAPAAARARARDAVKLTEHEKGLLKDFVFHEDVATNFDDIGGLDEQIREVEELVIFPLSHPHLYAHSSVAQQPTGVLLYGPPGTGKTMLARAIARTARANFISVNVADVQSKWFGETPKLVEAVFSLARKHSPCVVFVDEIDGVLSARNDADMAHVNTMKTKFMECWDGLRVANSGGSGKGSGGSASSSAGTDWVLVIGATNKPWALDPAVLRRMPRQIFIGLPDAGARASILRIVLSRERVAVDVDYGRIAGLTEGYSGSDLKEVIRAAALAPIREAYRKEAEAARAGGARGGAAAAAVTPRPITTADLLEAVRTVKPTGQAARDYLSFQRNTVTSFSTAAAATVATPPAPPMAAVATGVPITGAVAAAMLRGPPSTPKTPGPRGGSPGDGLVGAASPSASGSHVEYTFGPSAKANGLNLARAIEDVTKMSHKASYAQAAEAGKKAGAVGGPSASSRPTTPAKPVARSLVASGLEGIL